MFPRKRSSKLKLVLIVLILVIILAVAMIASTLREPVVNVVGLQIKYSGTGLQRTYRTFATVEVQNPNAVGVTVTNIKGSFYVNGEYGGDFDRTESVDIAANGVTTFDVEVAVKGTVPVQWNANNDVEVIGTIVVHGAVTDWTIPFDETRTVHVP